MYLRRLELRDFKAFEHARFDFPRPLPGKNVVLIGGRNGFGKTSLFEALALGLFGRHGIRLIGRAEPAADRQQRDESFARFVERAVFAEALARGRNSCRITLLFEDDRGEPLEMIRTWHFYDSGRLKPNSDEIHIVRGATRSIVAPPSTETDPSGWYSEWIFRTFMPVHQARFFLFDGEEVAVYAEREATQQIREAMEGLLGLTWLRELAEHLRKYAISRRRDAPVDEEIVRTEGEVNALEKRMLSEREALRDVEEKLTKFETEYDRLLRELQGYGPATQADLEVLQRQRADLAKEKELAQEKLLYLATSTLPFALVGRELRTRLRERIESEMARARWLTMREEGAARIETVLAEFRSLLADVIPPLTPEQTRKVEDGLKSALDRLWHPPPSNIADSFRHGHLTGNLGSDVVSVIDDAERLDRADVEDPLRIATSLHTKLGELDREIDAVKVLGPTIKAKFERLPSLKAELEQLHGARGGHRRMIDALKPQLRQKRADLRRLTEQRARSAPALARAAAAEKVASLAEALLEEARPLELGAIAEEMTKAIRAMVHRPDHLNRVTVEEGSSLRLLNEAGQDLRRFDLSAGEKQIFTQALFAAVAKLSRRTFPLVIDTPLGRLDEEHRRNVLRFLAERDTQVILLSSDAEVVGPYLDAIRDRVTKTYVLESEPRGSYRISRPVEGYFEG